MLEAAFYYRALGFSVLPLVGKAPHARLLKRTHGNVSTTRLLERGSTDEQLHAWFSEPRVNIGVFCGAASGGLVVIDFDECPFPLPCAMLPLTPLVKTGRGQLHGYHLYYRSDDDIATETFPWGEVRGRAPSYVVAPPSIHPDTGRSYLWQLPLEEEPLADFSQVVLPYQSPLSGKKNERGRKKRICPTEDVLLRTPGPTEVRDKTQWLRSFDTDPGAVIAMARVLGITAPLGTAFPCVLHPDRHPSAALHPTADTGEWLYHDLHAARHNANEWLSLAQVRATLAGRDGKLSPSEHATWKLILLAEAGLLLPVAVPAAPLPIGTDARLAHVYERFLFLLGCRWNYEYGAPVPFSRQFAAALCDVTERDARAAIEELERLGAIYVVATQRVGGARKLRLWLPRSVDDTHLTREAAA